MLHTHTQTHTLTNKMTPSICYMHILSLLHLGTITSLRSLYVTAKGNTVYSFLVVCEYHLMYQLVSAVVNQMTDLRRASGSTTLGIALVYLPICTHLQIQILTSKTHFLFLISVFGAFYFFFDIQFHKKILAWS